MLTIPQSEQCVIGGILLNPDCLKQIRAELQVDDFSSTKHKFIYQALLDVTDNGDPILPTSIINYLTAKNQIKEVGSDYLSDIISNVSTSTGWQYHVAQIKNDKLKKDLIEISHEITDGVRGNNAQTLLDDIKERIAGLKPQAVGRGVVELTDALPDVVASLERGDNPGITTGLSDLDELLGGWQNGDLIILAGRPGMGKSVLAKDFSEAAGVPVLFFSLEMPRDQLIKRQLSSHSNVNFTSIRRSSISTKDWPKIIKAGEILNKMPIAYSDDANMSIDEMIATCEDRKRKENIGMVVIDYLQLINTKGEFQHREIEVAGISRKLKALARSLEVPVICLAQLNRKCEDRGGDKKPMLSDLRESGAIEQDADTVIFVWREVVYKKGADKHDALLIVAKGRNTGTGSVKVYFDGSHQVFSQNPFWGEA